jgi:transposase
MAEPHPVELRQRVVAAYESGEGSYSEISERFDVGVASVKRWVRLKRELGRVTPKPKAGGTQSSIEADELEAIIDKLSDPTAREITAEFNRRRRGDARVHVSSTKRALHRHGYVVKKNAAGRWSVCGRTSARSEPHIEDGFAVSRQTGSSSSTRPASIRR